MMRFAILALLPALFAEPARAQAGGPSATNIQLDATFAAAKQHQLDNLQSEQSKGLVSRETYLQKKTELESDIKRLRAQYAANPGQLQIYDKEFEAQLHILRGEPTQPASERAGHFLKQLGGIIGNLITLVVLTVIGSWPLLLLVAFIGIAVSFSWMAFGKRQEEKLSTVYGSADFAGQLLKLPDPAYFLTGVFFGKSSTPELKDAPPEQNPGAPVFSWPENHVLICAKTRAGKGTRVIVPTLARYLSSMLVIDPKGENAAITARQRSQWSNIHILNPWGEHADVFQKLGFAPAAYNPLDLLDRNDPNAVAIAQALASAICPRDAKGKDAFWSDSAGSLLTAVLLWLTERDGADEVKTLARAREIVTQTRKDLDKHLAQMAACSAFGGAIRENAGPFVGLAQETYSGVVSNLAQHTRFLSDPQVKAATASSTFSMRDLAVVPTTVYLVIPPDRMETQRTWLRLLVASGMHTYKRVRDARFPGGAVKDPYRCMFLIDEFPALGHIQELPNDLATMAGYGVDFTLIVQGLDQLKAVYGDAGATIVNNCAFRWFCNVGDLHSAEYLSKALGKATVRTVSRSVGEKESVTYAETGRDLLTPDEILALGRDTALLFAPTRKPPARACYLHPVDYWELETAFAMFQADAPRMFWQPPLIFDPNPTRGVEAEA